HHPSLIDQQVEPSAPLSIDAQIQPVAWPIVAPMELGSVYLIGAERQEDADAICQEMLAPRSLHDKAALFAVDREPAELLSGLQDDEGPGELRLYRVDTSAASPFAALRSLPRTIARRVSPASGWLVLSLSASVWDGVDEPAIVRWLEACGAMLRKRRCALLILASGPAVPA